MINKAISHILFPDEEELRIDMFSLLKEREEYDGCIHLAFLTTNPNEKIEINGKKLERNCPKCIFYDMNLQICYFSSLNGDLLEEYY